ncbi:cytochrome b [Nocardia nepalensis]|uniref:cytochrome b n=1 Tax=Nocardia nepalensis TaxID=3375448 RepID=UPI003B67D417
MTLRTESLDATRFGTTARILHWLMAVLIVVMIFVGAAMVGYLGDYSLLLHIHKSVGLAILVLAVIRIGNRVLHKPPPQIDTLSRPERFVATGSEILMYTLFLVQPIVGWCLVSASGIPIQIVGGFRIPAIAPTDAGVYATLRTLHSVLAYVLLAAFVAHICAVLFHAMLLRDKLLRRMTFPVLRR